MVKKLGVYQYHHQHNLNVENTNQLNLIYPQVNLKRKNINKILIPISLFDGSKIKLISGLTFLSIKKNIELKQHHIKTTLLGISLKILEVL